MQRCLALTALLALLGTASSARAAETDPSTLYRLTTSPSPLVLRAGGEGTLVLELTPLEGAYLSPRTPFSLELKGQGLRVPNTALRLSEAKQGPASTPPQAAARFELPLRAEKAGEGTLTATMTFFICTETLCERQERTLKVPVSIR